MGYTKEDTDQFVTLLLVTLAPKPTDEAITREMQSDRAKNPHGDSYKPTVRSMQEVEIDLRLEWVATLIERITESK